MITKAEIKLVRSLSDKSARETEGLFAVEGDKIIKEALDSDFEVVKLYVLPKSRLTAHPLAAETTQSEMERLSHMKTPSHSIALVRLPHYDFKFEDSRQDRLILALDDIQDPGNLGTIIRLADWFGIDDIICSHATADCFNPKVAQATMGALLRVRLHYTDLYEALKRFNDAEVSIYGTFLNGDNIYESELSQSGVIVMGNEGRGISERTASFVNKRLYIPPYPADAPTSESLNVATATAIICSEFRRRL